MTLSAAQPPAPSSTHEKAEPTIVGPLKTLGTNLQQWGTGANRLMPEPLPLCQVILGGVFPPCQSSLWNQAFISHRSKLDNENLTDVSHFFVSLFLNPSVTLIRIHIRMKYLHPIPCMRGSQTRNVEKQTSERNSDIRPI